MNIKTLYIKRLHWIVVVFWSFALLLPGLSPVAAAAGDDSQQPVAEHTAEKANAEPEKVGVPPILAPAKKPPDDLWERIRDDLSWQTMQSTQVDIARKQFLRQPNYLPDVSNRADYYLYYIVEEVKKRDMPMEIALIPMIESSLNPFASGPAGAAGLWQIMPATGSHLGLERNRGFDGRKDLLDSTTVALDYLETLHKEFDDDWLLALAAYNSGAGNVARAREANKAKGLETDFWSLKLPGHTREYVPKVIALAQILADPERFDVEIPSVENAPSFEVVDTDEPLALTRAAELAGVDIDILRALNPGQLGNSLSPNQSGELLLPVGARSRFEYNIARLSPEDLVQSKTYRIKSGDNLGDIASKFNTEVALLQQLNNLQGNNIQAGDTLRVPGDGTADSSQSVTSDASASPAPQSYSVRPGDTLSQIARKYKVSVGDIMAWNALNEDALIRPGQKLELHPKGS